MGYNSNFFHYKNFTFYLFIILYLYFIMEENRVRYNLPACKCKNYQFFEAVKLNFAKQKARWWTRFKVAIQNTWKYGKLRNMIKTDDEFLHMQSGRTVARYWTWRKCMKLEHLHECVKASHKNMYIYLICTLNNLIRQIVDKSSPREGPTYSFAFLGNYWAGVLSPRGNM